MCDGHFFEAVGRAFTEITQTNSEFGGLNNIFAGGFRQLPFEVLGGCKYEMNEACFIYLISFMISRYYN